MWATFQTLLVNSVGWSLHVYDGTQVIPNDTPSTQTLGMSHGGSPHCSKTLSHSPMHSLLNIQEELAKRLPMLECAWPRESARSHAAGSTPECHCIIREPRGIRWQLWNVADGYEYGVSSLDIGFGITGQPRYHYSDN